MFDLYNYECDGQINMFDVTAQEGPQILEIGQKIFIVKCGDVSEEVVVNTFPLDGNRGYRTGSNTIWNSSIGNDVFLKKEEADSVAKIFLSSHDVIYPEDIHPIEVKAWHYIRDIDGRDMIAFYAIMEDGKAYIKDFYTFHHINDYGSVDKARKILMKEFGKDDFIYNNPIPIPSYVPKFKKMYKCRDDVDWDWAEAGYSEIIK